jgi:hypothetical protein
VVVEVVPADVPEVAVIESMEVDGIVDPLLGHRL